MNSQKTFVALAALVAAASLGACGHEPTAVERNFGASVRNMIEAQTHDPSTLSSPSTQTIESGDGRRLEAVLDAYRTDVAKPDTVREDVVISVDGGR
jgi:type IV pilus biogenesis protein CpaD/CtpE